MGNVLFALIKSRVSKENPWVPNLINYKKSLLKRPSGLEMFLILGGIRVIFAVPLIHLKSGAPPTVDPRVLNFKGRNFKMLLTIFWGRAHVFLLIGVRLLIGTRD